MAQPAETAVMLCHPAAVFGQNTFAACCLARPQVEGALVPLRWQRCA